MGKKITISELRSFIQKQAIKMYKVHVLNESKLKIETRLKVLNESASLGDPNLEAEVRAEVENRLRPTDTRLSFGDLNDISNEYNVPFETVVEIMAATVVTRDHEKQNELKELIQDIIIHDFNGDAPDFKTFYDRFIEYDNSNDFNPQDVENIRKTYLELTTDPNQLALFESRAKK